MIVEEENALGILSGHAYAILDSQEVEGSFGKDKIIKIRNPWGFIFILLYIIKIIILKAK